LTKLVHLSTLEREYNYTQKAFDDAEAFLATNKTDFVGTSNYAQFKEGREPYIVRGGACHAGMAKTSAAGYDLIATEVYCSTSNRPSSYRHRRINSKSVWEFYERDPKSIEGFFNWFVYESEFGRFILNRGRESVKNGWIFSTGLPASITQALCIVGRHFYECLPCAFETFDDLVSQGVPKTVAYVTAFNSYWSYYGQSPRSLDDNFSPLYNHRMFAFPSHISMLQNFNKGVVDPDYIKGSYCDLPSLNGTSLLFGVYGAGTTPFTYGLLNSDKELKEFVRGLRGDTSSILKVVNPFAATKSKDNPLNVTYGEMYKIILFLTQRGDFN